MTTTVPKIITTLAALLASTGKARQAKRVQLATLTKAGK